MSSARKDTNPAVHRHEQTTERNGICGICNGAGLVKKTFRVIISPFRRKPDGTMYTDAEAIDALEDLCQRWKKGPPVHHLCAMEITDKLAGFDINTGEYMPPPTNIMELFQIRGSGKEVTPGPVWTDPDVEIELGQVA